MSSDAERFIEYLPLDDLPANPANPKGHDLDTLEASMDRFGYTEPVMIDERTSLLVAGHGRVEQLRRMLSDGAEAPQGVRVDGETWLVPVVRGWASKDDAEASGYLIASNRLTELGGWRDDDLLALLGEAGSNGVGFTNADVEVLQRRVDAAAANLLDVTDEAITDLLGLHDGDDTDESAGMNSFPSITIRFVDEAAKTEFQTERLSDLRAGGQNRSGYWYPRKPDNAPRLQSALDDDE